MPVIALYLFVVIPILIYVLVKLFPFMLRVALKVLGFFAEYLSIALPWIFSAIYAVALGFYALGRQFFLGEDAKIFLEQKLPPHEVPRKKFSLIVIEVMLELQKKF